MKQKCIFKLFLLCTLMLFSTNILLSQTYTNTFSSGIATIYTQYKEGDNTKYNTSGSYNIGKDTTSNTDYDWQINRSAYLFNISSIPKKANIISVKCNYEVNWAASGHKKFSVTNYQIKGLDTDKKAWTNIGNSTIKSGLSKSIGNFTDPVLTSRIKTAIAGNGKFYLCAKSDNESAALSHANIVLSVEIKYEILKVTAKNDMDGYDGGKIYVGINVGETERTSPFTTPDLAIGDYVNLRAKENQTHNGFNWMWNAPDETESPNRKSEWRKKKENSSIRIATTQSTTYPIAQGDAGANLIGYLRKECNLTFTNNFNGISETGSIKVNDSTVSAPTAQYTVIEGNTIQIEAIDETYYDVRYNFSHWSDGNTENPRTLTASVNENITAVFIGRAIFTDNGINNRNMQLTFIRNNPTLNWNEHISPNVTKYKVWRRSNETGSIENELIVTLNRGTTTFKDMDFKKGGTKYTGVTLAYSVRAYYAPDQTESLSDYGSIFYGTRIINKAADSLSSSNQLLEIKEYALNSNYPNPFNPTTQISYQIPENSFVSLVVYNTLGQEVTQLINQHQSSGQYSVQFNAANLPSGVYMYKLQVGTSTGSATEFSSVKKMMLTK